MSSSVDGLVSGLSTSSLISQLMQVEAAPQARLKTKVTAAQTAVKSYQSVNKQVAAFKSAGDAISQLSSWRAIKATSSSSTVSATTSASLTASTGSLTFDVKSLASKQSTTMQVDTSLTDADGDGAIDDPIAITGASTITITKGTYGADVSSFSPSTANPITIDISADRSAAGIAKAINAANAGVTAYVMKTADNQGVLQINSAKTGADNGFQIAGLDGQGLNGDSPATTVPKSAEIVVNGGGGSTYSVTSSTNTFTGLMSGVTIGVTKEETGVTVDVASDTGAIADKFQALVDAANATLSEIGTQTAYDPSTKKGSPLTGDFSVREMSQKILSQISQGLSYPNPDSTDAVPLPPIKFGSLKGLGIQLDSTGQLSFDKTKFLAAYAENPAKIQQAGIAFGDQVESLSTSMTTNLTSVITGRNNEIDNLNDQVANWDVRLAAKRTALQKQYSDLEVALGKLKDQSSWLSGQLAGLS